MKFIEKKASNEPRDVKEKRLTPGSGFDDLPKDSLRKALLSEQGCICAYCMQRIKNAANSTKIDHWESRDKTNEKNYKNLLAVCKGNEGRKGIEHCDTLKKKQSIKISPLQKSCEGLVKFDSGGNIYADDAAIEKELKEILGLNIQSLVEERKKLIDSLMNEINQKSRNTADKKVRRAILNQLLKEWRELKGGQFRPFCQVAIAYIEKKIARP